VIVAYGLIHERRIGEYTLPDGSVIVAAGNRAEDNALVRPMSSALVNRLVHVHLRVSTGDWLEWAAGAGLHPLVLEYVGTSRTTSGASRRSTRSRSRRRARGTC